MNTTQATQNNLPYVTPAKLFDWGEKLTGGRKGLTVSDSFFSDNSAKALYQAGYTTWLDNINQGDILRDKDFSKVFAKPDINAILVSDLSIYAKALLMLQYTIVFTNKRPNIRSRKYTAWAQGVLFFHYLWHTAINDGLTFGLDHIKPDTNIGMIASGIPRLPSKDLYASREFVISAYVLTQIDMAYWGEVSKFELVYYKGYDTRFVFQYSYASDYMRFNNIDDKLTFAPVIEKVRQALAQKKALLTTLALEQEQEQKQKPVLSPSAERLKKIRLDLYYTRSQPTQYIVRLDKKSDPLQTVLIHSYDRQECNDFMSNVYIDGTAENEQVLKLLDDIKTMKFGLTDLHPKNDEIKNTVTKRQGDITPAQMGIDFNLRGIEFGEWVQQGKGYHDRQDFINKVYDGFADLADILGVSNDFIGLKGTLGFAMGARGRGQASAHYETANKVINLTKTKGNGTLAHEWLHAFDNYQGAKTGSNANMRSEHILSELLKLDSFAKMAHRAGTLDTVRGSKVYFGLPAELVARYFESMVRFKLNEKGLYNDFLVGYNNSQEHQEKASYPYVRDDEHNADDYAKFWQLMTA